jgi:choline dehydrogenase
MRGAGGPLGVSRIENDDELVQAIIGSAQKVGWEHVEDTNAHDSERIGYRPSTISHGRRNSAYSAFVRQVRQRSNLSVATQTRAISVSSRVRTHGHAKWYTRTQGAVSAACLGGLGRGATLRPRWE